MKHNKKILFHMLFVIAVITAALGFSGTFDVSYAAADDVYFEEPYVDAGDTLTVKYEGSNSELNYKWYVDGEIISFNKAAGFEISKDHYEKTIKAEVWSGNTKLGDASMFCSKLPVLYIDTEGGAEVVSKDDYLDAQMHLQGNDLYNTDNTTLYTGKTEIKGRGNSTWELFPKKPYRLKLDKKTDLFGLGKEKNWVLLANYIDESNMRNMLAGDMATRMGVGAMDGTWVELIMNGKPQGTYMLCEHVRLSEDRVNVFDWEEAAEDIAEAIAEANGFADEDMDALTDQMVEEDMSWISTGEVTYDGVTYHPADYYKDLPSYFSGGYLMEMDYGYDEVSKFTTANGATLMFKSPEFICTDEIAMNIVQSYIQTFEDALYSPDHCADIEGKMVSYVDYCDIESMVNFWLASEILMNEIGCKSTYFQKDINKPIEFGPVWDFDFSSGSVSPFSAQNANDWTSDNKYWSGSKEKWWFNKAMQDPYFAVKARETYLEQEEYLKNVVADGGLLDEWYEYLKEAGNYNYELWKYSRGFEADYEALSAWFTERINWMDEQFATNETAVKSLGANISSNLKPELQGEGITLISDNSYRLESGHESFDLHVSVDEGEYTELNYYINSEYEGTVSITEGEASVVIREDQLTEDIGKDNVITVWLKDEQGELTEQQYVAVKLTSDDLLYNVVFNDMGGSYSEKVAAGEKVYIKGPKVQEEYAVFEGWSDGKTTYPVGEWMAVNSDMELNAVWTPCSDGTNIHNFVQDGDVYECSNEGCTVTKESVNSYINITACALTCSNRYDNYYNGKEIKPVITLSYGDEKLVADKHYTIEYKNNINVGYATYIIKSIKGAGYKGEFSLSYRILPQDISKAKIAVPQKSELSGSVAEPDIAISYNGIKLIEGTDYLLSYTNSNRVGTASVTISGIGNYTGSITKNYSIVKSPKNISKCTVTGHNTVWAHVGREVKPTITVKDGSKKLINGTHYTVKYSDNIKCGTAKIKITGIVSSGYQGTKTVTFKIRPGRAVPKVVNVNYNEQKVTWSKVTGATEYYIYRSLDNKTYKYVKKVKATANRVYKSKYLDTGKTYYYRVRAVIDYKTGNETARYWSYNSANVKAKTVLGKGIIKSVKNTASRTATIKWAGVKGANGYKVYRADSKNGTYKLAKLVKYSKQYSDKKLKKGKTYYYKVKPYRKVDGRLVYGEISKPSVVKIAK